MLLAGRDGNYSAPPPEKSMLGILRGAWGDFPRQAILKELSSRLSGIRGSCPPPLLSSNFGLVAVSGAVAVTVAIAVAVAIAVKVVVVVVAVAVGCATVDQPTSRHIYCFLHGFRNERADDRTHSVLTLSYPTRPDMETINVKLVCSLISKGCLRSCVLLV